MIFVECPYCKHKIDTERYHRHCLLRMLFHRTIFNDNVFNCRSIHSWCIYKEGNRKMNICKYCGTINSIHDSGVGCYCLICGKEIEK
jgi:hypothetical protein